jgi:hypothetical protein
MASKKSTRITLPYDATSESRQDGSSHWPTAPAPLHNPFDITQISSDKFRQKALEDSTSTSLPMAQVTMNNAEQVDENGIPITYTPITRRISKAKKGKKVHACEYGCGKVRLIHVVVLWLTRKVFTRAEHRK